MAPMRSLVLSLALLLLVGCVPKHRQAQQSTRKPAADRSGPVEVKEVTRPSGLLTRKEAQAYVVDLINRDRALEGLHPVVWDDTAARAGQIHAEDMVRHGFTSHWGSDGSVPELRYTEVGGEHMVQENAGCFADGKPRELDPDPKFDPAGIEKVQAAFFDEKPPNDGHRKNILKSWHTHVGVGLAKAKGVPVVCLAQEFVDDYGSYEAIPKRGKVGERIRVAGEVREPAKFVGVSVARATLPEPRESTELLTTGTYPIPKPHVNFFPKGFVTPVPVQVDGSKFSIEVPLSDRKKPGLYEISVWGEVPGAADYVMISLRTIKVPK